MASKKKTTVDYKDIPTTLKDHPFYGITLDDSQLEFVNAIWDPNIDIVFCNAKAGSGKTLCAVATANLLYQYNLVDGIVYIVSPTQEQRIGFLPGEIESKIFPYTASLYDALIEIGVNPNTSINQTDIMNEKTGSGYIDAISHLYLRGKNIKNKCVIVEESQNMYKDELKKILTRVDDASKIIVIGHTGQCDLLSHPERSGFAAYIEHFSEKERCAICNLTTNHRGWVAEWADELQ